MKTRSRRAHRQQILTLCLLVGLALPAQPLWAQSRADPWDISWLPSDRNGRRALDRAINALLEDTGLRGQGPTIRENAQRHKVNPAFALAIFRKEAGFATRGTRANRNRNPANIVATGECWGEPAGTRCEGLYGEVGTDGRFGRYASMEDGIEAFFVLLEREYAGMTLYALVNRACPPVECDVPGYVALMEEWTTEYQAQMIDALYSLPEFEGTVIDDRGPHFWRRGPDEYWHRAPAGYDQHMWWTRNNQAGSENAGRWALELAQPGTYEFFAYIPPLHATSRQSRYTIYCAGQTHETQIDQYSHRNEWVSLGRVHCAGTEIEYVELSDETGEEALQTQVAFDAVGYRLRGRAAPVEVPPPRVERPPKTDTSTAPATSGQPVLLERLWNLSKRLFPICCGVGVLILGFVVLAIVFCDRLPSTLLIR